LQREGRGVRSKKWCGSILSRCRAADPAISQKSDVEDENLYSPHEGRVASVINQVGTNPTGRETDTILV